MSIARAYARALFEMAQEKRATAAQLDLIQQQLDSLVEAMNVSRELKMAMTGPATDAKEKASVMAELAKRLGIEAMPAKFIDLMARKERLDQLSEVRVAFEAIRLESENGVLGEIISADAMNEAEINEVASVLGKRLGKQVRFKHSTDPTLLAGMKVIINGTTYDGSLRAQIARLRDRLVHGTDEGIV